jgi:hypothetical protein
MLLFHYMLFVAIVRILTIELKVTMKPPIVEITLRVVNLTKYGLVKMVISLVILTRENIVLFLQRPLCTMDIP